MRVLMFGWEFPPFISGGLGTACKSIVEALARKGTEVIFVMPHAGFGARTRFNDRLELLSASGVSGKEKWKIQALESTASEFWEKKLCMRPVNSLLFPYATPEAYMQQLTFANRVNGVLNKPPSLVKESLENENIPLHGGYGPDLMTEVYRFSLACAAIAQEEEFDVIHAHDWMTYPAGILASQLTGKPLVVHMHAMEYDRSGENMNAQVARLEWTGLTGADRVVAVSHYTKGLLQKIYNIPEEKIEVVHNAVSKKKAACEYRAPDLARDEKLVLFMGRVTYQKGPEYFVEAARLVNEKMPNVRFVMAGSGDMLNRMVRRVAELRLGSRFHFTGFLHGEEVDRMYALSDLYVMPSVSEPFGIAPLEAMVFDTPVLITRQSGVSEVTCNALKVDFWDVHGMAAKICAVLSSPVLAGEMVRNCREELKHIKWENSAEKLNAIYSRVLKGVCLPHQA